jgi:hypothetical protein
MAINGVVLISLKFRMSGGDHHPHYRLKGLLYTFLHGSGSLFLFQYAENMTLKISLSCMANCMYIQRLPPAIAQEHVRTLFLSFQVLNIV